MADRKQTASKYRVGGGSLGARPLKRAIQQRVENPLATRILAGEFGDGDSVKVDYEGNTFVFKKGK